MRDLDPIVVSRRDQRPGFAAVGPVGSLVTGVRPDQVALPMSSTNSRVRHSGHGSYRW